MAVQKFHVRGLTHEAEPEVERRLRAVAGVLFALANHEDACAEVEFEDDAVTAEDLAAVLAELGYEARFAS